MRNQIIKNLEEELGSLDIFGDTLQQAEKGITITKQSLNGLKKIVVEEGFNSLEDEIYFFKHSKPKVYSNLIYYVHIFNIESRKPRSSNTMQVKYCNEYMDKLQAYFNDNIEFYQYYRSKKNHFDEYYFVRGKSNLRLYPDTFHYFTDSQFSTSHDSTVATIIAYDMLIIYLKSEIDKLLNSNLNESYSMNGKNPSLHWTANKADLIELIYALHCSGAINRGATDIKTLAIVCERIFNIDLGNYYHVFVELKARKTSRTKFLSFLKESLIKRMNESDE